MQPEAGPFRGVFDIDLAEQLVHRLAETLGGLLCRLRILELEIEVIDGLAHIGETHEEFGLQTDFLLGLPHRIDELRLVQLLTGERHDAVHLAHHVDGRGLLKFPAHLDKVVHVVTEESGVGGDIGAVALALLQLVELQEMLVRGLQLLFGHELVVVEVREHHRFEGVVQGKAEAALGGDVAELLVERLLEVEMVKVLLHIDFRVAAFPGAENLQLRPIVFRKDTPVVLVAELTEFGGALGVGPYVGAQLLADLRRDVELLAQGAPFDVVDHRVKMLIHGALELDDGGGVGGGPEGDIPVLDGQPHERVVAGGIVVDGHHAGGCGVTPLDDARDVAH